jgi:hypothetical protein
MSAPIIVTDKNKINFWKRVEKAGPDDCWLWTGSKTNQGYGQMRAGGVVTYVHRISWVIANGDIPQDGESYHGTVIRHKCDTRLCVNPKHLEPGTQSDNLWDAADRDRIQRNREKPRNSKLDEKDVEEIRKSNLSPLELALRYEVLPQTIWSIRTGRTWTSVPK